MTAIDPPPAAWTIAGIAIVLSILYWLTGRSNLPLPPGPRKLPLVGNLFNLPSTFGWKTFREWSRQYSQFRYNPLESGRHLYDRVILVRSNGSFARETLIDIFGPARNANAHRSNGMGFQFIPALMKYGETWRSHRRLFSQAFSVTGSKTFRPKELAATHGLLRRLLHAPDAFRAHIKQMAGEVIISVAYGINVLPVKDPYISLAEEAVHSGGQAVTPGRFLVDAIPVLKHVPDWFPGAGFKRLAKEWRQVACALTDVPFAEVKRQIASGTASHSFTAESLRIFGESSDTYYNEDTIKATAATMYVAGSDTTVAAISTFFLAMLANPDAQKKAQMEIDTVIGQGQLPHFNDEESLPYVSALVKEVLRWQPVTPIGVPHFLAVEDEYRGYRIPAGSVVIGNVWAILKDEDMYPDSSTFKPERFLRDGKLNPDVRDPQAAFGFGRRICPGRHMAMSSVWIAVVSILAVFDITKAVEDDGQEIEPTYEYSSDFVSGPLPFKCSIRPRSRDAAALIEVTANEDHHV